MTTSPPDVGDRFAAPQPAEPTPPPELPDTDQSNATRYLCVGAQIDDAFGDSVIQEVLEQHHRAVAPTFGLDLIRVVVHALNARGRRKRRDLLLVILAVADLLIAPVITIVMALSWLWIRFVYRLTRQQRPSWHQRYALYLATIASVIVVPVLALTALLLSVVVGLLTPYVASMPVILVWPARLGFWLPSPLKGCLVFLSLGLAWSVLCWHRLSTRRVLLDTLRPDAFRLGHLPLVPDYHPRIHDRFMRLQEDQRSSNVTVYSGFSPFLGAGDELQTWGFTVDLSQGAQRSDGEVGKPRPFSLTKLHRHVRQRVQALSDPELPPEQRISNLVIEDRLFVSGDAVQRDRRFLPRRDAPPVAQVSPRVIHEMLNKPTGAIRHFKCIRVDSWTREVGFSDFLHFAILGRTLYVEQTACRLLPIRTSYHLIDQLTRRLLPGQLPTLLGETLKELPASLLRAPVELIRQWRSKRREQQQDRLLRRLLDERLAVDYGARLSVRELGQTSGWRNYFQDLDWYRQLRVVQSHVLDAVLDFLEEHDVDTSEFRQRQSAILNNGVFMPGGTVYNSTVAAGPGASAEGAGAGVAGPGQSGPRGKP
jgi:hypothetical protein